MANIASIAVLRGLGKVVFPEQKLVVLAAVRTLFRRGAGVVSQNTYDTFASDSYSLIIRLLIISSFNQFN